MSATSDSLYSYLYHPIPGMCGKTAGLRSSVRVSSSGGPQKGDAGVNVC